ncbi:MAG: Holliday junction branch migration protein RuvA [Acidiferrobacterales bacterium]|nr:Holliday junction branch migration protein RuvA [Acidiferrobacterales bacterium]
MIGFLRGVLLQKQPPHIVLDVHGVGYELEAPMATFYDLPEEQSETSLYTHLVVREDAQLLFGFSDRSQRELFRSLLKVNGVGPRVGLAILSTLSASQFVQCVKQQDAMTLTSVPGIGKKTAERMLIDMRDRIEGIDVEDIRSSDSSGKPLESYQDPVGDAIGALVALGYRQADANRAVKAVEEQSAERDDLIRNALQMLSKR